MKTSVNECTTVEELSEYLDGVIEDRTEQIKSGRKPRISDALYLALAMVARAKADNGRRRK